MKLFFSLTLLLFSLFACKGENKSTVSNSAPLDEKALNEVLNQNTDSVRGNWVNQNAYENRFFNIAVSIPGDWFLTKGQDERRNEAAAEFLSGDDKNLKGVFDSAIKKTMTVFWAYRYPPGTPGKTNPNISMVIERVEHLPGIQTENDYLQALESTLKMSNRSFIFKNPPARAKLGELEFWSREAEAPIGNLLVKQRFYVLLKNRTILLIGLTSVSPEDAIELEKITSSFKPLAP